MEESALNEFLEIEVEIQKPCPCGEKPEPDDEYGRFQCNDNGFLQCGMCQCDKGWYFYFGLLSKFKIMNKILFSFV